MLPPEKVARWLHLTLNEFRADLPALRLEGFPASCPVTGHYDRKALEAWQDRRSGLVEGILTEDRAAVMLARIDALG
jgi:hypothetical protein